MRIERMRGVTDAAIRLNDDRSGLHRLTPRERFALWYRVVRSWEVSGLGPDYDPYTNAAIRCYLNRNRYDNT